MPISSDQMRRDTALLFDSFRHSCVTLTADRLCEEEAESECSEFDPVLEPDPDPDPDGEVEHDFVVQAHGQEQDGAIVFEQGTNIGPEHINTPFLLQGLGPDGQTVMYYRLTPQSLASGLWTRQDAAEPDCEQDPNHQDPDLQDANHQEPNHQEPDHPEPDSQLPEQDLDHQEPDHQDQEPDHQESDHQEQQPDHHESDHQNEAPLVPRTPESLPPDHVIPRGQRIHVLRVWCRRGCPSGSKRQRLE
jgi:hypothetical protein